MTACPADTGPCRLVPGEHPDPVLVAATMAGPGRPVIPLWPDRRTPLTDPDDPRTPNGESGPHHRNLWHETAAEVLATAESFPQERRHGRRVLACSWGVVLGEADPGGWRLVVLDTDTDDAEARLVSLLAEVPGGPEWLARTMTVRTARGFHRYGLVREPLATGKPWGPEGGLDLKALGGYVVLPGCRHPSGTPERPVRYTDVTPEAGAVRTDGERPPGGVWQRLDLPALRAVWSVPAPVPPAVLAALPSTEAAEPAARTIGARTGGSATAATTTTTPRTTGPAFRRLLETLRDAGRLHRVTGEGQALAHCPGPAHLNGDRHPGLSVTGAAGRVLLRCHAGCETADVLEALGLRWSDLFDDDDTTNGAPVALPLDDDHHDHDDPSEPADLHAARVSSRLDALRVQRDAVRLLKDEDAAAEAATMPPFDAGTLAEVLARLPEPPHRVEGLILSDALTLVVAQRKTGKTTLCLNLAFSLITGEPFLGAFPVRPLRSGERVALLNYEVSAALAAEWADRLGVPRDRFVLVSLRGRRNPLGNPVDRAALAEYLRGQRVASVMGDPFSRMFTGDNSNDAGQVTRFLAEFDGWARGPVGARDVVLSAHAGWEGERARNSSALEDAPDSIITMTSGARTGDPQGRYLRALGRGVEVDEDRLSFDPVTLRMSMSGRGSREQTGKTLAVERLVPEVVQFVADNPGSVTRDIDDGVPGKAERVREARKLAVTRGLLRTEPGTRNASLHYLAESDEDRENGSVRPVRPTASHRVPDAVSECVPRPIRDADALTELADTLTSDERDALESGTTFDLDLRAGDER